MTARQVSTRAVMRTVGRRRIPILLSSGCKTSRRHVLRAAWDSQPAILTQGGAHLQPGAYALDEHFRQRAQSTLVRLSHRSSHCAKARARDESWLLRNEDRALSRQIASREFLSATIRRGVAFRPGSGT